MNVTWMALPAGGKSVTALRLTCMMPQFRLWVLWPEVAVPLYFQAGRARMTVA
jgi:hypothetical protein